MTAAMLAALGWTEWIAIAHEIGRPPSTVAQMLRDG
jgi:hypothetical protein